MTGAGDERGTLRFVTDAVRAAAVAEARTGQRVSLARIVRPAAPRFGPVPAPPGEQAWQQTLAWTP